MNKAALLRPVNRVLAVSLVIQVTTAILMYFHVPVPKPKVLFSVHENNGILLIALVITHIFLNWGWVKANMLNFKK